MPFELLTDTDIDGKPGIQIPMERDELARKYRALRQHHVEETERLLTKDRALLAQMAATLGGPAVASPSSNALKDARDIAVGCVYIARLILAEVDRK